MNINITLFLFLILSVLTLLMNGCTPTGELDLSQVSKEDVDKLIVCNENYMRHGTGCCLDVNSNRICDSDESMLDSDLEKEERTLEDVLEINSKVDEDVRSRSLEPNKMYVGDIRVVYIEDFAKGLKLENIGQSSILVDVEGIKATIGNGDTKIVNEVEITVDELFYGSNIKESYAIILTPPIPGLGNFMYVEDTRSVGNKMVTLENVGQSSVLVDVDGVKATIANGATKTVNGIKITVDKLFYRTQPEVSGALIITS